MINSAKPPALERQDLDPIEKDRFTLIGLPLKMIGAEASPVRAVAVY